MVKDPLVEDYFVGQNGSTGDINIYGYPNDRRIIFANGMTANYDIESSVIIYNNSMRSSDLWIFQHIAETLADMDSGIRVNMQSQKTMPIIPTTQEQALTIENIYSDIEHNIPYVMVDANSLDVEKLKDALTFDNRKSFTADLMIQVQREIWNRFLTYVGINNVNVEKRERVNVSETNANLDEIMVMRRNRLNARQRAADLIYEQWGLKVTPHYYSEGRATEDGSLYDFDQDDSGTGISGRDAVQRPDNPAGEDD